MNFVSLAIFDLSCGMEMYQFDRLLKRAKQNVQINKLQHFAKFLAKSFLMEIQKTFHP